MRGTTIAAVFASTLLAISGCATPGEPVGSAATAAPTVSISGLDNATASACTVANQATLGQDGYDFDIATANQIVTLSKQSKSTLITAAANVVEQPLRKAEATAGEFEQATHLAELRTVMLKFQTVCQDVDALTVSIQESQRSLDADAGETTR
ncbi:hypothetical protein FHR83_001820 [Actinoplanes campanulatus]|uniref:Uncharacterized protein n=1 Tax=Actinoplanes campanulatus TaxID=113559 RepID=A0A7W5AD91_9ACTN|nr:hypothetical protein [Actinoplanes campanulatus]MBB3094168.1 hypothetical protein [Actinoplanes campanulatus]GGN43311.1 hypothetical protein GCM10010109_75330 [Actinoplanes campanulatus]GID42345.1 hypothetical protein Aca09nite_88510 [Actinoplanes campanulatus]